jgi:hypothetical protein
MFMNSRFEKPAVDRATAVNHAPADLVSVARHVEAPRSVLQTGRCGLKTENNLTQWHCQSLDEFSPVREKPEEATSSGYASLQTTGSVAKYNRSSLARLDFSATG